MGEERTHALVVPDQGVIYSPMAMSNHHNDFGVGGGLGSGLRFAIPDLQDCDYEIVNYDELEKMLPDPKPLCRVELGLLPDGQAYAPKTASKENFLLFPSKSSYILYFTHHYFSRENLNRDHTFLSMLVDKFLLPLEKLVKAPRLAALNTTTEDVEKALSRSKIVCLEDLENGQRAVRRIDGYPASILPEERLTGSIHHSVPPAVLMGVPGGFTKSQGPQFPRSMVDEDSQRFMAAHDIHVNYGTVPTSANLHVQNSTLPAGPGHLVRVSSGQSNQTCISSGVPSLSSCTNTTPSDIQPMVTSLPNSNLVNSTTVRPNTGSWQYQPQSLFVVGSPYSRQSISQPPTIGAVADNSALLYGFPHPHQGHSVWGMRARYPYPTSPTYNSNVPIPGPGADSHQIASGLPVRHPSVSQLQHYLFGHSNLPNAYPNSLPIYPINPPMNPINLTMTNSFTGQSISHQNRHPIQTPFPPQYTTNPFFAGNSGHFTSAPAAALNTHTPNVNFTNPYINMALATMAAATQQHQTASSAGTGYFHPPIGISQNPYQGGVTSPVPIVYATQSQLPLHLARQHPRLPPPSQVSTVYALSTPYHMSQVPPNPTVAPSTPGSDLCAPQPVGNNRAPESLSNPTAPNHTNSTSSSAMFNSPVVSGSSSQTITSVGGNSTSLPPHQLESVSSPGSSSLHSSGQISNLHSIASSVPSFPSSLAAAAAGLSIQYPSARSSTVSIARTNPFGGASYNLNMSTGMIPTSYCSSPLQTVNSGSSGVGSKSDTPNVDLKADELNIRTPAQQDGDYVQVEMERSQSANPLAEDIIMPSDEANLDVLQLPASVGVGGEVDRSLSGNLVLPTVALTNSPDDSTDDSISSGIGEMNSHCSNGCANAGESTVGSHSVEESTTRQMQERRQVNKNNYVFVSCKRRQSHVIPVKESKLES